jgi:superfamily II DNA or RNA helicase
MSSAIPEQGQLVEVRARPWVVADVEVSTVRDAALEPGEPQHFVTLRSIEDDAEPDETLRVIWQVEPSARVLEAGTLPHPAAFDEPGRFDAFLDAVRWGASSQADSRQLLAPFQSGVEIDAYQLEPLARALRMPRVGLLIADDVGLGKTIEAGLIAQELLLRYRARRILIVTPADLQLQWRDEMRDKFGLEFWVVDTELVKKLRRARGIHANPWSCFPRLITSYDWLKRERPMRWFRETLPQGDEPRYPRRWDLLIVDEAANIAPSGRAHYATDSLRTEVLREIVPHCEHRLFLTATPHNGFDESFSALLELLDDQRFARAITPTREQLRETMVRRLKTEITDWDGNPRFPVRALEALEVEYGDDEREAHADLRAYAELRSKRAAGDRTQEFATQFISLLLKKRLFSSPAAFARTLATHRQTILRNREEGRRQSLATLQAQFDRTEEPQETDDQFEDAVEEAQAAAAASLKALNVEEDAILSRLERWAERAVNVPDAKAKRLLDLVETVCRPGGEWSDERIIIFSEYRDTQKWLFGLLAARGFTDNGRTLLLYGGQDDEERAEIKAAFQADPAESPVRILLATDSASEGINLQNYCHRLVHYEIPWNPNRMEQRNGRVDRRGQGAAEVLVYHFAPAGFEERYPDPDLVPVGDLEGDLEFLRRAVIKVDRIRDMLGKVGPVIADQVSQAMSGHRRKLETENAEREGEIVRKVLAFERRLAEELRELQASYDETRAELRLTPDHIKNVVDVALALAGQPALSSGTRPGRYRLPALSGAWARCSDGAAHPFTHAERELVFDPTLLDRDEVILCHLGHRLVQMSLRLLRAEVWQPASRKRGLERATARVVDDPRVHGPLVCVHARLVVTGADGHRLHEEVVQAGGFIREGRLERLGVTALRELLALPTSGSPSASFGERLIELHPELEEPLGAALTARAKERTASLERIVEARQTEEVEKITAVLTELRDRILTELNAEPPPQLSLFDDDERDQLNRNRTYLEHRAEKIPAEIEAETAALRSRFADPEPRVFPVAVEYLVPKAIDAR